MGDSFTVRMRSPFSAQVCRRREREGGGGERARGSRAGRTRERRHFPLVQLTRDTSKFIEIQDSDPVLPGARTCVCRASAF